MARPKKTQKPRARKKKQPKEATNLQEVRLLLDFCNVRRWNQESLREFYHQHGFTKKIVCRTRNCKYWFALEEDEKLRKYGEQRTGASAPSIIFPSDDHYDNLLQTNLMISQGNYEREFLEKCIAGKLDMAVLNRMVAELDWAQTYHVSEIDAKHANVEFVESSDQWNPDVLFDFEKITIESFIELGIINVFLRKDGQVFSRISKCPVCESYFLRKRADNIYCGDKCGNRKRSQRYTDSGKRAQYMREKRAEGKYL